MTEEAQLATSFDDMTLSSSDILLRTKDGSTLIAERQLLVSHSSIFKNTFELPVEDKSRCDVEESESELQSFMRVLKGEPLGDDSSLKSLTSLARMGDKYDSFHVKSYVGSKLWWAVVVEAHQSHSLRHHRKSSPVSVFALAIIVQDKTLAEEAAHEALASPGIVAGLRRNADFEAMDVADQMRLENFLLARKAQDDRLAETGLACLRACVYRSKHCQCVTNTWFRQTREADDGDRNIWIEASYAAEYSISKDVSPVQAMRLEVFARQDRWRMCHHCNKRLREKLNELERMWERRRGDEQKVQLVW